VQVSISGGLGESERGGPSFNIIPKTGGNTFSGTYFGSFAGKWGQSSNVDEELRRLGFADQPALHKAWDTNFALGGPILRDRLWFFGNTRLVGSHTDTQSQWGNRNAGDPNLWTYARDEGVRVRVANGKRVNSIRFTWQATRRNKLGFYMDYTNNCTGSSFLKGGDDCREPGDDWTASGPGIGPGIATVSPESGTIWDDRAKIVQASYSSPVSNRVLVEGGVSSFFTKWGDIRPYGALTDFIPVTEQSTAAGTPFANFIYRGWNAAPSTDQQHATWRGTVSYVTGTHSLKIGYQAGYLMTKNTTLVGRQISYRFNNGVPNQMSQRVGPNRVADSLRYDALFVQDQWTRERLTLQGGLRYETARSWAPGGQNGIIAAHQFGGELLFPRTEGVRGYHDITPRMGVAYDLFGTGKTALKVSVSKYTQGASTSEGYTINNPGATLVTTVNRSWTDPNGNRVAECDYMDPAANGECGAWSNLNWGSSVRTTQVNPDVLEGWNVRTHDWQFSVGVTQELLRGRLRDELQPAVVGQLLRHAQPGARPAGLRHRVADGAEPSAPARRRRLPGDVPHAEHQQPARGDRFVLHARDGLRRRDPLLAWHRPGGERQAAQRPVRAGRDQHRARRERHLRGGDRPVRPARAARRRESDAGLPLHGAVADEPPRPGHLHRAEGGRACQCHLPLAAQRPAGTSVASNGGSRALNYQMSAAQFLAATGRPLRPGLTSQTVNLLLPGDLYGDRVNVVDVRFAKILRFGRTRANVGLDLYNMFNRNTPSAYDQVFDPGTGGARWMQPTSVLLPRFVRFNVQLDF
jgi:hypothetical protein